MAVLGGGAICASAADEKESTREQQIQQFLIEYLRFMFVPQ
jgi:hypothetical protein